jgi:hypothetical protein
MKNGDRSTVTARFLPFIAYSKQTNFHHLNFFTSEISALPTICLYQIRGHCLRIRSYPYLTFVGPCNLIYLYSKTNQMHNTSSLFYFGTTLYMFRTVSRSIISNLRLYMQHRIYVMYVLWLLDRTCMT